MGSHRDSAHPGKGITFAAAPHWKKVMNKRGKGLFLPADLEGFRGKMRKKRSGFAF